MSSNFYTTGGSSTSNSYNYEAPSSFPFTEAQLTENSIINRRIDFWVYGTATGLDALQYHTWVNSGDYDYIDVWLIGAGGGGANGNIGSITGFPPTILGGGGGAAGGFSYYRVTNPSGDIVFQIGPGGYPGIDGSDVVGFSPYGYMSAKGGRRGYSQSNYVGSLNASEAVGFTERGQICSTISIVNVSGVLITGANRKIHGPSAGGYGYTHVTGGTFLNPTSAVWSNAMESMNFYSSTVGQGGESGIMPFLRSGSQGTNLPLGFVIGGNGGNGGGRGQNGGNGGWPGGGGGGGGMNWAGSGAAGFGGTGANGAVVVIGYKI